MAVVVSQAMVMLKDDEREILRIKEFLAQVDKRYYHRIVENRKNNMRVFPHNGEDGKLFLNTFQYVNLFKNDKK